MTTKRRVKVTVETERVFAARTSKAPPANWCERCGSEVRMLTPDEAAVLARTSVRVIYRRIEAERLHFVETDDGWILICLNSLSGA